MRGALAGVQHSYKVPDVAAKSMKRRTNMPDRTLRDVNQCIPEHTGLQLFSSSTTLRELCVTTKIGQFHQHGW